MNKAELVIAIAEHTEIDRKTVAQVLNGLRDVLPLAVAADDVVSIPGLGTFEASRRAARVGRNVRTGEPMTIPETWAPKFTPSQSFKSLVKESEALKKKSEALAHA